MKMKNNEFSKRNVIFGHMFPCTNGYVTTNVIQMLFPDEDITITSVSKD